MAKIELEIGANVQDLLAGFEQMKKQMSEFDAKMKGTFEKMSKEGEDAAQSLSKAMTDSMTKSATSIDKTNNAIEEQNNLLIEEQRHLELFRAARDKATSVQTWELYNKQVKKSEQVISNLSRQLNQFKDITNMSLGEMRKYMRELRNISLVGMSPKQIAEVNGKIAELTDAMGDYRAMLGATGDKTEMVIESFQGLVGIAQGVTGTLTLFGVENKKLEKSMMALINLSMAMQTFHQMNEKGVLKSTAALIKDTIATWANNNAKKAGTGIAKGFFKVIAANPFTALAAAIAAAAIGIGTFVYHLRSHQSEQKLTNDLLNKAKDKIAANSAELEINVSKLRKTYGNQKEFNAAVNEWNTNIAGKYTSTLLTTSSSLDDISRAAAEARSNIIKMGIASAAQEKVSEIYKDNFDYIIEYQNKLDEATKMEQKAAEINAKIKEEMTRNAKYATTEEFRNLASQAQRYKETAENLRKYGQLQEKTMSASTVKGKEAYEQIQQLLNIVDDYTVSVDNNVSGIRDFADVTEDATDKTKELAMATATILDEQRIRENLDEAINYYDKLIALNINDYEKTKEYLDKKQQAIYEFYDALLSLEQNKAEQDGILTETERARIDELTAIRDKYVSDVETMNNEEVEGEEDKWRKLYDISKRVAGEAYAIYGKYIDDQISKLDEYVGRRTQVIGELESLLAAEVQLNEQGYASNIQIYQQRIQKEQQLRDEAMAQKEKYEKRKQAIETVSQAIDMSSAIAAMLKDAGVKFGVLAPIIGGAMIAALLMLFKKSKTQAAQTARFAKGGKGILQGASHSAGGVNLGEIGEGEGGEAYYILNKKATAKNRSLMDAVFDAVNGNRINLPLDAIASGGGTMTVELKEQAEIKEILKHMKSQKATVYGNGFRDETFGNVRRRIWTN